MIDEKLELLIKERTKSLGGVISILEAVQETYGYLPENALRMVAEGTGKPLSDIYGVATFYKAFSLKPRGKHCISVCLGTACHVRGAPKIFEVFSRQLGIAAGETTPDKEFTLETVNCLGACALGPTVVVDGRYFRQVSAAAVGPLLDRVRKGFGKTDPATDERIFPLEAGCPFCGHDLMDHEHLLDSHPSIRCDVSSGKKKGWLRLSCLYGSYTAESEYDCKPGHETSLSCPHCKKNLAGDSNCPECGATMAMMAVRSGATLHICVRRGCRGHRLELKGTEEIKRSRTQEH